MLPSFCEEGIVEIDRDKRRSRKKGGYRGQGENVLSRITIS